MSTPTPTPAEDPRDHPTETRVGGTGGLPGANAAPATAETPEDELKDTVDGNG